MTQAVTAPWAGIAEADVSAMVMATQPWIDELRGARILITGATGWFGKWLLAGLIGISREYGLRINLVATSRDPIAFSARQPALFCAPEIEWLAGDVRTWPWRQTLGLTHIIHAATESSGTMSRERPDILFDTIVVGTRNMLAAAEHERVRGALLLSSGAVYGSGAGVERFSESHGGGPDPAIVSSAYAEGKRCAEQLVAIAQRVGGVSAKIARCFAFVGPHMPMDAHFAIGNFIRDGVDGGAIVVRSDGRARRSYLYMTDLVTWLVAVLVAGQPARPYNVGSSHAITIGELAARLANRCGVEVSVQGESPGSDYVPDVERIRTELKVSETVDLDTAIDRTIAWRQLELAG